MFRPPRPRSWPSADLGLDPEKESRVFELWLSEPEGYRLEAFDCPGAPIFGVGRERMPVKVSLLPGENGAVGWLAGYVKE